MSGDGQLFDTSREIEEDTMSDDKQFNIRRRKIEEKWLQQKNYWNNLVQTLHSQKTAIPSATNKLSEINKDVNDLQTEKVQYDEQKYKLETEVVDIFREHQNLETHLKALKERARLLDENTLEEALKLEAHTLKDEMDRVFEYFNEKMYKLDGEIDQQEAELAKRKESVFKIYTKACAKSKKAIEKRKVEYNKLSKNVNIIGKLL